MKQARGSPGPPPELQEHVYLVLTFYLVFFTWGFLKIIVFLHKTKETYSQIVIVVEFVLHFSKFWSLNVGFPLVF